MICAFVQLSLYYWQHKALLSQKVAALSNSVPGPAAQKSDTLTLVRQVTQYELSLDDRNRLRPNMQVFHTYTDSRANEDNSPPPIIPNPHIDGVDYAVGMIMRHQHLNYTCVIYGWDPLCSASDQWMLQMGVDQLALKGNQPFYNVLVADGTSRYAAQENLEVHRSPTFVNHPQIGRYFERFCSTYFLPNLEKKKEYPDDANIVLRYLAPVEP
ncbi:unnamed protein product [Timema podura]|uniref:Hemimethylated DNA-binding domain-containing protein n=1 Tax=Timema podura TaxID=61482 RepID=A0ABN7NND2_TIMPD|nr:unnamed protein product [Timema podura]